MRTSRKPYYSPSQSVEIASGATETIEFSGRNGNRFAFNRILFGCDDPTKLNLVTAKVKIGSKEILIPEVQVLALNRLFYDRTLEGSRIIDSNRTLRIELTNKHSGTLKLNGSLNGFDGDQLDGRKRQYEEAGRSWMQPEFLLGNKNISASAKNSRVEIELPDYNVRFNRMAVSSEYDNDLKLTLRYDNDDIMPERFLAQINNEFQSLPVVTPFTLEYFKNLDALVTNLDGANSHDISIIVESYKTD